MRAYVLTRAAYGPEWSREANERRLAITRAVTARLMAAQTNRDWTWVVLVDPRDPILADRRAVFTAAAPRVRFIRWRPEETDSPQTTAFLAYQAPWRDAIGPADEPLVQVRLDDDDGLATDALERYAAAAAMLARRRMPKSTVLMFPRGVRVWDGRYVAVRHGRNAMHALVTGPGTELGVYDYPHTKCHQAGPVLNLLNDRWGWLWVRHRDTISGWKEASAPITDRLRSRFPADWPALEAAWR